MYTKITFIGALWLNANTSTCSLHKQFNGHGDSRITFHEVVLKINCTPFILNLEVTLRLPAECEINRYFFL